MKSLDHVKRSLSYVLIASVLLGAGLGIAAVLRNQWSWFEVRVLLTTGILAAASLCGLACDLSRTPRGLNLIPYIGLGLTLLAAILCIALVWLEGRSEPLELVKAAGCTSVFAIATAHVSLLSVARLAPRHEPRTARLLLVDDDEAVRGVIAKILGRAGHEVTVVSDAKEALHAADQLGSALELLSAAYAVHPAFAEARIVEIGAGLRPAFPDNLPRIRIEGERISVNGLYRHGFLLAPALAELTTAYLKRGAIDNEVMQCV